MNIGSSMVAKSDLYYILFDELGRSFIQLRQSSLVRTVKLPKGR